MSGFTHKAADFFETLGKDIDDVKKLLDDSASEIPYIPTQHEIETLLNELDEVSLKETSALMTYQLIADQMSSLLSFLVDNNALKKEEIIAGSSKYISDIYLILSRFLSNLKKTKWDLDTCDEIIYSFLFLVDLIGTEKDLCDEYAFDFFADVSELWELIINITDEVHEEKGLTLFSQSISELYIQMDDVNDSIIDILNADLSLQEKKKVFKKAKVQKYIYTSLEILSDLFLFESYRLTN